MIRLATYEDIPDIILMLTEESKKVPIDCAVNALSPQIAAKRVRQGIDQGLCFVSSTIEDKELSGFILGVINHNVWSDTVLEISMLSVYVKPEFRKTMAGGRLMKTYVNKCNSLMEEDNNIKVSWLQIQQNTDIKHDRIERLGYRPADIKFIKE